MESILESNQQFSIKLLVEWIVLRICARYAHLFEAFAQKQTQVGICHNQYIIVSKQSFPGFF